LIQEFALSHIGMAAAVGHTIDIPIMIRALTAYTFRGKGMRWDPEFLMALDAGDDEDDLAAVAPSYKFSWWSRTTADKFCCYMDWDNIEICLEHHRRVTGIKEILPQPLRKQVGKLHCVV
jgi:hypothetical protein